MAMSDIEKRVEQHRYEIDGLKESAQKTVVAIEKLTEAVHEQTKQFAVFATTHDLLAERLNATVKDVEELKRFQAASAPVVEAVRGMAWKMVLSVLCSGSGAALIATLLTKS